jgi:hypothetical protein
MIHRKKALGQRPNSSKALHQRPNSSKALHQRPNIVQSISLAGQSLTRHIGGKSLHKRLNNSIYQQEDKVFHIIIIHMGQ